MYSYIYAERNNLNYFIGCKTKQGIDAVALHYIQNMVGTKLPSNASHALKDVFGALERKDIAAAMTAWDYYAQTEAHITITCHVIEPLLIVE